MNEQERIDAQNREQRGRMFGEGDGTGRTQNAIRDYEKRMGSSSSGSDDRYQVASPAPSPRPSRPSAPAPRAPAAGTGSNSSSANGSSSNFTADDFFTVAGFLVAGGLTYSRTNEPISALIVGCIAAFIARKVWKFALALAAIVIAINIFGN